MRPTLLTRTPRALLLAACLSSPGLLAASPLCALQEPIARIDRILETLQGQRENEIKGPTDRVDVTRGGQGQPIQGRPDLPLLVFDEIGVTPRTLVRIETTAPGVRGEALLSTDASTTRGPIFIEDIGAGPTRAVFELRPAPRGDVGILVRAGTLVVNWLEGTLEGFVGGIAFLAHSKLIVSVSPDGNTGGLYLVEGSVTFPDFPGLIVRPGEVVRLQAGLQPVIQAAEAAAARQLAEATEWALDDVWPRSFFQQPMFYAGAALVGGAAVLAITQIGGESGAVQTGSGTVIFTIPF